MSVRPGADSESPSSNLEYLRLKTELYSSRDKWLCSEFLREAAFSRLARPSGSLKEVPCFRSWKMFRGCDPLIGARLRLRPEPPLGFGICKDSKLLFYITEIKIK